MVCNILATLIVILMAGPAFAFGGIFPIKVKGVEYCGGSATKLTTKTAVPLWVEVNGTGVWWIATDPSFHDDHIVAPIYINRANDGLKSNTLGVMGGVFFNNSFHLAFDGVIKLDKDGNLKSVKGNFAQVGIFKPNCWSHGKFKTGKRVK